MSPVASLALFAAAAHPLVEAGRLTGLAGAAFAIPHGRRI
jgi:hypothetical protein